jgi:hypothetical protein
MVLLTGSVPDLSAWVLFSFESQDLIDPADGDAGQLGDLLGIDALAVKGDNEPAALLVESAWGGDPQVAGVVFLDFFQQVRRQDLFGIGVFIHSMSIPLNDRIKCPDIL